MQCVPTAAADKTWRKWGLDRVPVVVKLCSFLSSFRWFIHSLLLPFFFACEHRSMQEAFHAVFYSICEGHTHTHTHTQRVFVFSLPSPIRSARHLWLQQGWNCCLPGHQDQTFFWFQAFIFLRNSVISADNLPLRLWTAHQPLTVCSAPTII